MLWRTKIDNRIYCSADLTFVEIRMLKLLEKIMAETVKLIGGAALKIGVPLPLIDNVTIADDAQIVTRNGYVRVDFDFTYE
uniref:Uncharacterized protein n=1 Tax=Brugia malayi TaxID=6279 RepID=A8QFH2_BRUMA